MKSGEELIDFICDKIRKDKKFCTDSQIVIQLRKIDKFELMNFVNEKSPQEPRK